MTNTKKRRKLLWGMRMMMRDIELIHGWHEPLRSYMRLYVPNGGEVSHRIHIRRINRILKCIDDFAKDGGPRDGGRPRNSPKG